jgi:hypothetical protein
MKRTGNYKGRTPKRERNRMIVDMRDNEHKTFARIAKELNMDRSWAYHIYRRESERNL